MWFVVALFSAALLGFYDVFKKIALAKNAVLPVLFFNTLICSFIFLPLILLSAKTELLASSIFYVPYCEWDTHVYIIVKSFIVLFSWVFGYFAIKHLPITIVGPVNAMRPVMVLVGAMLVFGETLNIYQWIGVLFAVVSFVLLNRNGKKEGLDFKHNVWIYFLGMAALFGAVSGLYDKFLMASKSEGGMELDRMFVQSWYNIYQCVFMFCMLFIIWWPKRKTTTPFKWRWSIICVSLFLSVADFLYFYCLTLPGAMISIVSMIRRSSVIVSFLFGFIFLREKNIKGKTVDLLLVILGLVFLCIGSIV